MKTVTLIGSGFSSLSAACYMAKNGYKVTLFEKNDTIGGRARQFTEEGFTFDNHFGRSVFIQLIKSKLVDYNLRGRFL